VIERLANEGGCQHLPDCAASAPAGREARLRLGLLSRWALHMAAPAPAQGSACAGGAVAYPWQANLPVPLAQLRTSDHRRGRAALTLATR
jgi:hypothetical protein